MSYSGNWERIEDPSPDIMCATCMDMVRRKTTTRFHILPWKWRLGTKVRGDKKWEKDQLREGDRCLIGLSR